MSHLTTKALRSVATLAAFAFAGMLFGSPAYADVDITGDWVGKGKCEVLDQLNNSAPERIRPVVQLTFFDGADATSGGNANVEGMFDTLEFGTVYFRGYLFASDPVGKDRFVGYYMTTPPTCGFVGNQDMLYGTVKRGTIKLQYFPSTSAVNFGSCKIKLKQTSTTGYASPCQ